MKEWLQGEFKGYKEEVCGDAPALMLCDNMKAQKDPENLKYLQTEVSTQTYFGPTEETDKWQPVDQGWGQLWKQKLLSGLEAWIDEDPSNELQWEEGKMTARDQRVLLTQLVGTAHQELESEAYEAARARYFMKTGCGLARDARHDAEINVPGVPNYQPFAPGVRLGPLWRDQAKVIWTGYDEDSGAAAADDSSSSSESTSGEDTSSDAETAPAADAVPKAAVPKKGAAKKAAAKKGAAKKAAAKSSSSGSGSHNWIGRPVRITDDIPLSFGNVEAIRGICESVDKGMATVITGASVKFLPIVYLQEESDE